MKIELFARLSQNYKNRVGKRKGYGTCPNCGDTLYQNELGSIVYINGLKTKIEEDKSSGITRITLPSCAYFVIICKKCLGNPRKLDPKKIKSDLLKSQWDEKSAEMAAQAILAHKTKCLSPI